MSQPHAVIIPLPKRFGLCQTFSREYILDSKWFGVPNHFVVVIMARLQLLAQNVEEEIYFIGLGGMAHEADAPDLSGQVAESAAYFEVVFLQEFLA